MKTTILLIVLSVLSMFLSCCSKLFPDEKLTLQRRDYAGNELRIDGYYYNVNYNVISIYFLYRNGIILYGYSYPNLNLDEIELKMLNNDMYNNSYNKSKANWGVFIINEESIKIEKWEPSTGIGLPVYIREGNILNDTTFHITLSYDPKGSNKSILNELYHFKKFAPKPDSTNVYIK